MNGTDPSQLVILILGTSLTLGYGVPPAQAYPALVQHDLDAVGVRAVVLAKGVAGEHSDGPIRRLAAYDALHVSILVLETGANDALIGTDPAEIERNIDATLDSATRIWRDVHVVLVGVSGPPLHGDAYTRTLGGAFARAAASRRATLLPNLLEGVVGRAELNQRDGIHPNAAGHRVMARHVSQLLIDLLKDSTLKAGVRRQ